MYLVAIAWMYVVLMMAVAEATSAQGSVLGALVTFVLYGVLPLSVLLYILGTPMRARARKAREAAESQSQSQPPAQEPPPAGPAQAATPGGGSAVVAVDPDQPRHAPGDAIPPVGKVP